MGGSIVFARWRQCALLRGHIGATWRIRSNLCFLQPTRVHNPDSKMISHFSTAHCRVGPLSLPESRTQMASRSGQPFMHSARQTVPILYNGPLPQNCPFPLGIWTPIHLTHSFLDGPPLSPKMPFTWGMWTPYQIHGSLGPPESSIQMAY